MTFRDHKGQKKQADKRPQCCFNSVVIAPQSVGIKQRNVNVATLRDALLICPLCKGRGEHTGACCLCALEQISQLFHSPIKAE